MELHVHDISKTTARLMGKTMPPVRMIGKGWCMVVRSLSLVKTLLSMCGALKPTYQLVRSRKTPVPIFGRVSLTS